MLRRRGARIASQAMVTRRTNRGLVSMAPADVVSSTTGTAGGVRATTGPYVVTSTVPYGLPAGRAELTACAKVLTGVPATSVSFSVSSGKNSMRVSTTTLPAMMLTMVTCEVLTPAAEATAAMTSVSNCALKVGLVLRLSRLKSGNVAATFTTGGGAVHSVMLNAAAQLPGESPIEGKLSEETPAMLFISAKDVSLSEDSSFVSTFQNALPISVPSMAICMVMESAALMSVMSIPMSSSSVRVHSALLSMYITPPISAPRIVPLPDSASPTLATAPTLNVMASVLVISPHTLMSIMQRSSSSNTRMSM
mmetsp:Transcript_39564/g.86184  ORF Transcript_39564/g.86184 Transcript_39564/m.86184 type:complete len:308 (-) Transcript_39564:2597-3520(-)